MDAVRKALYQRLASIEPITTRLGNGAASVFTGQPLLSTPPPYITIARSSATDHYTFGPAGGYEAQTWIVKAIDGGQDRTGDPQSAVEDLAELIQVALHDAPLAIVGKQLMWCRRETGIAYPEVDGLACWFHAGGVYRLCVQ